jgi:very-short-patch-repair endonuclease
MEQVQIGGREVVTRADLLACGMRPGQIARAVRDGDLVRVRRDRYMVAADTAIARAVRVGGRMTCVSLLVLLNVFVLDPAGLHIHLERTMSRLRSPDDPAKRLDPALRKGLMLHWWPLRYEAQSLGVVGIADALAHAVRCQTPRAAVATVDSVIHLGLLTWWEVRDVFGGLPARYRVILALADGVAESGPETFMRLILRQLGVRFDAQVDIPNVGRVDFLVCGWLIIECDSKAHHEGWEKQRKDRKRDLEAAKLGYTTLRLLAEDIMYDPAAVILAVRGIVRTRLRAA